MEIDKSTERCEAMVTLVGDSLRVAKKLWQEILERPDSAQILKEGTFGLLEDDKLIRADVSMGQGLTNFLLSQPDIAEVITEEGEYGEAKQGRLTVFVDPLDSSANAVRILERQALDLPAGHNDLPFGVVLAFAENKGEKFSDVAAAGFVRLDTGFSYMAVRGSGFWIIMPDGKKVLFHLSQIPNQPKSLTEALTEGWTVWVESYYPETRTVVNSKLLTPDEKGYIRSQGCSSNEQTTVALGEAAAFFVPAKNYMSLQPLF